MTYKQKQNLIRIGVILVAIALVFAAVKLFSGSKDNGNYSKTRVKWTVGTILSGGSFDSEAEDSMVSDRIEIGKGFKIVPDFNKSVSYNVYYYDEKDNYLGCNGALPITNILEMTVDDIDELFDFGEEENPFVAKYIRIVMTPDDKDGEIKWLEKQKYARHIEVYELESTR